jgi:polysaccharide pyruvyl transferase WcaK-like protein
VRILVDQSGYDLLNLGDVAMLQSCVARLQMQWPDAEILVITHASARATAVHTASRLRDDGRDAYAQFRIAADGELTKVTAAGREGGV